MTTNRALWDRIDQKVVDYPRNDDEPVSQLDEDRYLVLTIVREPEPQLSPGLQAVPAYSVNLESAEWNWGWEIAQGPPRQPNYQAFYSSLLTSGAYATILGQEPTAGAARALAIFVSAIQDAMNGRENRDALQGAIWLLLQNLSLSEENLSELHLLMVTHGLDAYSLEQLQ